MSSSREEIQQIPQELLESRTATLDPPGGDESQGKSPPALSTRNRATAKRQGATQPPKQPAAKPAATPNPPTPPKPPVAVATGAGDAKTPRKIIQDAMDALIASKQAKIIAMQSMGEPRQSDGVPGYTPRQQDEIVLRIVYVIDR